MQIHCLHNLEPCVIPREGRHNPPACPARQSFSLLQGFEPTSAVSTASTSLSRTSPVSTPLQFLTTIPFPISLLQVSRRSPILDAYLDAVESAVRPPLHAVHPSSEASRAHSPNPARPRRRIAEAPCRPPPWRASRCDLARGYRETHSDRAQNPGYRRAHRPRPEIPLPARRRQRRA